MERLLFIKRFLSNPKLIGSITPSSRFLAKKMILEDEVRNCQTIIELGAGNGIFTKYVLQWKEPDAHLFVFEKDPYFAKKLQNRYPEVKLFSDADMLVTLHHQGIIPSVDLIVSSLPFTNVTREERKRILEGVIYILKTGGRFVTYQYSLQLLKELKILFPSVTIDFELFNLPPAIVYRCTKGHS